MRVRTNDHEVLTSKGWINAHWTIDLPLEEAKHLIALGRVSPLSPAEPSTSDARPAERRRKNAALPAQLTR